MLRKPFGPLARMCLNFYLERLSHQPQRKKEKILTKLTVFKLNMLTYFLLIFSKQINLLIKSTLMTPGEGFLLENLGSGEWYICYSVVQEILFPPYFRPTDIIDPFCMYDVWSQLTIKCFRLLPHLTRSSFKVFITKITIIIKTPLSLNTLSSSIPWFQIRWCKPYPILRGTLSGY